MCLLPVARRKFGLDSEEAVSIVLEEDGTSVDEEDYFQDGLGPSNVLMLLKSNETWTGIESCLDSATPVMITVAVLGF